MLIINTILPRKSSYSLATCFAARSTIEFEKDPGRENDRSDRWRINEGLTGARASHEARIHWKHASTYADASSALQVIVHHTTALIAALQPRVEEDLLEPTEDEPRGTFPPTADLGSR